MGKFLNDERVWADVTRPSCFCLIIMVVTILFVGCDICVWQAYNGDTLPEGQEAKIKITGGCNALAVDGTVYPGGAGRWYPS